jgi:DNA polymerase
MTNAERLQYLDALGIDVWVPRTNAESDPVSSQNDHPRLNVESNSALPISNSTLLKSKTDSPAWLRLQHEVSECQKCSLSTTRKQTVFGAGSLLADVMLIGEAPGESEDQQGLPFVGKAGQLLTEMIRAMGLQRDEVFICNILKCRPPNNRDPKAEEVHACGDYLQRQITQIQPRLIMAVGRIAAQQLLQSDASLAKLRGTVHRLGKIPVIALYHPAYLLRSPLEKRKAWNDIQIAIHELGNVSV